MWAFALMLEVELFCKLINDSVHEIHSKHFEDIQGQRLLEFLAVVIMLHLDKWMCDIKECFRAVLFYPSKALDNGFV